MLTMLPSLIGSAVAFSAKSGVVGTAKEMMASAKAAAAGLTAYPENSVITSVLPNMEDRDQALERAKEMRERQLARLKELGVANSSDMKRHALEQAATVNTLLAEKASATEAAEYREWVMGVATAVAKAAKEGGFLGFGGDEVSEPEEQTLAEISTALGL